MSTLVYKHDVVLEEIIPASTVIYLVLLADLSLSCLLTSILTVYISEYFL